MDSMEATVPESWSEQTPAPRAPVNKRKAPLWVVFVVVVVASIVGITVAGAVMAAVFSKMRPAPSVPAPTAILPRVRWEYKTVTLKPTEMDLTGPDKTDSQKWAAARERNNYFSDPAFEFSDKMGEFGWELVAAIPNTETVFAYEKRIPNTRVAEIMFVFKRPSPYSPITHEEELRRAQAYLDQHAK